MSFLRRWASRFAESDQERLAKEILDWASSVEGTVRIGEAPLREHVKVAGVVNRLTVRPVEGLQSIEAAVSDGTGEATAVWMGRTSIPGLVLGTRVILEGVMGKQRGRKVIVNPRYEFG